MADYDLVRVGKRVISALDSISNAIQRQIDAVRENAEANQQSREPQPTANLQRISGEIDFPVETKNNYYAEQDKTYRLSRQSFWF